MVENYFGEKWKVVKFDFEHDPNSRLEVSNFGRVRSFNKNYNGYLLKGTMINGYKILKLSYYTLRDEATVKKVNALKRKVAKHQAKVKQMIEDKEPKANIKEATISLKELKANVSQFFYEETKSRLIRHSVLVHKLVANYFLSKPTKAQKIVAHLDYDKLNNAANNLKWLTLEESYAHTAKNPDVIKRKRETKEGFYVNTKTAKLTVIKVMLLKKMLNEEKPMKQLVKLFKVTDTQILRIKRGENWSNIPAAH